MGSEATFLRCNLILTSNACNNPLSRFGAFSGAGVGTLTRSRQGAQFNPSPPHVLLVSEERLTHLPTDALQSLPVPTWDAGGSSDRCSWGGEGGGVPGPELCRSWKPLPTQPPSLGSAPGS